MTVMEIPELTFTVEEEDEGGFGAHCSFPGHGLFTQGDSLAELRANIEEVIQLYLDDLVDEFGPAAPVEARYVLRFNSPVRKAA